MSALTLAQAVSPIPPWHPHPDVWLLVATLAGGYLYAVYRIGPRLDHGRTPPLGGPAASPPGGETAGPPRPPNPPAATRRQIAWWMAGVGALWVVSDWPIHDLGEQSSFAFHTLEHVVQALVAAPLLLLGTPRWLARALLRPAPLLRLARFVCHPVAAFLVFNGVMLAAHWPEVVRLMLTSEAFHLAAHGAIVVSGLIMWMPVLSPLPEVPRLSAPLQMLYLFLQSVLPTIPASFLTFADAPLYPVYEGLPVVWGLSTLEDQQISGLLMKIGGGLILWGAITVVFFRWWMEEQRWDRLERELRRTPDSGSDPRRTPG